MKNILHHMLSGNHCIFQIFVFVFVFDFAVVFVLVVHSGRKHLHVVRDELKISFFEAVNFMFTN